VQAGIADDGLVALGELVVAAQEARPAFAVMLRPIDKSPEVSPRSSDMLAGPKPCAKIDTSVSSPNQPTEFSQSGNDVQAKIFERRFRSPYYYKVRFEFMPLWPWTSTA
jgi:hypothetical protein